MFCKYLDNPCVCLSVRNAFLISYIISILLTSVPVCQERFLFYIYQNMYFDNSLVSISETLFDPFTHISQNISILTTRASVCQERFFDPFTYISEFNYCDNPFVCPSGTFLIPQSEIIGGQLYTPRNL
jgi:hypothetical protein